MKTTTPDLCAHVFVCAFGDWQVQAAPRARSDMGGAQPLFEAIATAHHEHVQEAHSSEAQREAMRRQLERMNAPASMTTKRSGDHTAAYLIGSPLPRWWVDR